MENRDTLGLGAAFSIFDWGVTGVSTDADDVNVVTAGTAAFFFAGFLDTDRGLNINGFPTNLTSPAGCCSPFCDDFGGGRLIPDSTFVDAGSFSSSSV
jgi:hypothetical protein